MYDHTRRSLSPLSDEEGRPLDGTALHRTRTLALCDITSTDVFQVVKDLTDQLYPANKQPSEPFDQQHGSSSLPYLVMLRHLQSESACHNQDPAVQQRLFDIHNARLNGTAQTDRSLEDARGQFLATAPSRTRSMAARDALDDENTVVGYTVTG